MTATMINEHAVELNEVETKLRDLLLKAARYINPENPSQLRFTGGWVRDKLLGISSHDIDVSINDMTGYDFAVKLKEYLDKTEHEQEHPLQGELRMVDEAATGTKSSTFGTIAKIEANPEKSKHLETVTTKVYGLDIDFVNLRKETYSEDSRNPTMEFGSPEEDALRRDATINALFYNLQSGQVEDFTARGLDDLELKIIRTPLEPYQTFKDDPLRVLRLIRFASRLSYTIEPSTKEAMRDETIKASLKLKISRERVGVELDKMIKGPDPNGALALIDELGLYTTIFCDPTAIHSFVPDLNDWSDFYECVSMLLNTINSPITEVLITQESDRYLAWILCAFVPLAHASALQPAKGKPSPPLATSVAREGIKASNKVCDVITSSVQNFQEIITTKDKYVHQKRFAPSDDVGPGGRDVLGMAIRRWGPSWRNQMWYAMLMDQYRVKGDPLEDWDKFLKHLKDLDLLDVVEQKPLINGSTIAKALNTKPGPWMKEALEVVMGWQLRHPQTATEQGALEAVREFKQQHDAAGHDASGSQALDQSQGELVANLVNAFLLLTIRPLFAKTTQAHADLVTPQGRRVERAVTGNGPNPRRREHNEDEIIARPWKTEKNSYSLDLLEWAVKKLDSHLAEKYWPFLIPPILTLLDDMDTKFKARGCDLLRQLLEATPPSLLKRTGLGEVFEQALSPSLSYLPSLTPEPDSILILNSAYQSLFVLISSKAALLPSTPRKAAYQTKALSDVLHKHLLPSFSHIAPSPASISLPYPMLTATLLIHLNTLISRLKLDTIPQLQNLVPLLSEMMTSLFIMSSTESLQVLKSAINATQSVIACSWIRIERWRAEILSPCCEAWLAALKEERESSPEDSQKLKMLADVKSSLQVCVSMLVRAVEATSTSQYNGDSTESTITDDAPIDIKLEIAQLVHANTKLQTLFI